jgi:hypothetical protein
MFNLWLEHQQQQRRRSIETGERIRQIQELNLRAGLVQNTQNAPNMNEITTRLMARRQSEPIYKISNVPWTGKETFLVREESMEDLLFEGLRVEQIRRDSLSSPREGMEEYDANQGLPEEVSESPRLH